MITVWKRIATGSLAVVLVIQAAGCCTLIGAAAGAYHDSRRSGNPVAPADAGSVPPGSKLTLHLRDGSRVTGVLDANRADTLVVRVKEEAARDTTRNGRTISPPPSRRSRVVRVSVATDQIVAMNLGNGHWGVWTGLAIGLAVDALCVALAVLELQKWEQPLGTGPM